MYMSIITPAVPKNPKGLVRTGGGTLHRIVYIHLSVGKPAERWWLMVVKDVGGRLHVPLLNNQLFLHTELRLVDRFLTDPNSNSSEKLEFVKICLIY